MTGLELIAIKDGKATLFKVRHDGYAVEDYIDQFKSPTSFTTKEAILHFKNWFFSTTNFGPENEDDDVETNYVDGYDFASPSNDFDTLANQAVTEIVEMEGNGSLPNGEDFDGLTCGYDDYRLLIDLNTNQFKLI